MKRSIIVVVVNLSVAELSSDTSTKYVKKYNIPVHENKGACNSVMADGTVKQLLHIVMKIPLVIQSYRGTVDRYVMPIATYDMILGVPFHERHDPITYHYKREVHLHCDNKLHILKQPRGAMSTMRNDILISAACDIMFDSAPGSNNMCASLSFHSLRCTATSCCYSSHDVCHYYHCTSLHVLLMCTVCASATMSFISPIWCVSLSIPFFKSRDGV